MEYISFILVMPFLLRAVYTDIKRDNIENGLIAAGLAAGILFAWKKGGGAQVLYGMRVAAVTLACLFPLFLVKGLGAGDIKLFCMLAMFLPERMLSLVVWAFLFGAAIGIGKLTVIRIRGGEYAVKGTVIHFSIPIAMAAAAALCWR